MKKRYAVLLTAAVMLLLALWYFFPRQGARLLGLSGPAGEARLSVSVYSEDIQEPARLCEVGEKEQIQQFRELVGELRLTRALKNPFQGYVTMSGRTYDFALRVEEGGTAAFSVDADGRVYCSTNGGLYRCWGGAEELEGLFRFAEELLNGADQDQ